MVGFIERWGTIRTALAALTAISALYFALVAFSNITDPGTNWEFVKHVLAMDTTFGDPDLTWRKITAEPVAAIAYGGVIVWETATAVVLGAAFVHWVRGGRLARQLSILGWTMSVVLFAGGFITVGGEWFAMWQSDTWNGLQPALQNFLVAGLGLVLVQLSGEDSQASRA